MADQEKRLLRGDLKDLDIRRELPVLRSLVGEADERGHDLVSLFKALAEQAPIALTDLAVGPGARGGRASTEAALQVLDVLEENAPVSGLYRRLLASAGGLRDRVLQQAARRHPGGAWNIPLADQAGERPPGRCHLQEAASHPAFTHVCFSHAAAGHLQALVSVASDTGRPEPAAALLATGAEGPALEAAAGALKRAPRCEVVAHLAAVWGPEPAPLLARLMVRLDEPAALHALLADVQAWPALASQAQARLGSRRPQ